MGERMQIVEHSVHHGGYTGRSRANIWFVPETQWGTAIVINHGETNILAFETCIH